MVDKTFVCLSKSKKNNDFCVAGKLIYEDGTIGEWIRPINQNGTITSEDCCYSDHSSAHTLDIISATFLKPTPQKFQTENYTIDSRFYWEKVDEYEYTDATLSLLCDTPNSLWDNNNESGGGTNDQVSPQEAQKIDNSLYFIYVEKLTIDSSKWENKLKLRGEFVYNNTTYNLKITDIYWLDYYEKRPLDTYIHDNAYITISLALDTFGGFHYKLIADILS
ncbi:dual OB domain-containing protein [Morganella morganii]